ncbi:acyltransferase domain-containing protein [Streptomyces albidoflavus]
MAGALRTDRPALRHRLPVSASSVPEAVEALRAAVPAVPPVPDQPPKVAFLLPGGGTQYVGMGSRLTGRTTSTGTPWTTARPPAACLGSDLRTALFEEVEPGSTAAFMALFVTEYALARTLMEEGVRPDALIGHSLGEYTAACLAGVMEIDEALPVVAERIRLIASSAVPPSGSRPPSTPSSRCWARGCRWRRSTAPWRARSPATPTRSTGWRRN